MVYCQSRIRLEHQTIRGQWHWERPLKSSHSLFSLNWWANEGLWRVGNSSKAPHFVVDLELEPEPRCPAPQHDASPAPTSEKDLTVFQDLGCWIWWMGWKRLQRDGHVRMGHFKAEKEGKKPYIFPKDLKITLGTEKFRHYWILAYYGICIIFF